MRNECMLEGSIPDIQDSYKYLSVPQTNRNSNEDACRSATATYLQKVSQLLGIQLNGRNKIQTICAALPVIRY